MGRGDGAVPHDVHNHSVRSFCFFTADLHRMFTRWKGHLYALPSCSQRLGPIGGQDARARGPPNHGTAESQRGRIQKNF